MRIVKTFMCIASALWIPLFFASLLIACGKDNTAGTDEQANSVTAQIDAAVDSASAIWFQGEKSLAGPMPVDTVPTDTPLYSGPYGMFITVHDSSAQSTSTMDGIRTELGLLRQHEGSSFSSISCETAETWYDYAVFVKSELIQKVLIIPDTLGIAESVADEFKNDCIKENGEFVTKTESATQGQLYYSCEITPDTDGLVVVYPLRYTDPNWEKYGKQIIKICRE